YKMTLNCLESISKVRIKDFDLEVVVVDNGSTDGSVREIQNSKFKIQNDKFKFKIIENKENLGFVGGNNVGIEYALKNGADYVCLLNNDTRADPDFLIQLFKVAEEDPQNGVVGGKIYFEKGYEFHKDRYDKKDLGKVIWYAGGVVDWQNVYGSHRGVDEVDQGQFDSLCETGFVTGCLMFIRNEVFEKIGLIDERYYLYNEDNDFSQKAKKAGFKLMYSPKAIIWHINAGSSSSGSNLQEYFMTRNRLLFGFLWAPMRSKIALFRESFKLLLFGRPWQKIGVRDFYLGKLGKGSWK
ncbi:MAG: glycosyltransferase family 2 protein, partial [Patescibacteria group bacterium]